MNRVAALMVAVALTAGLGGCTSGTEMAGRNTPGPGDVATYQVEGPIYLPGFWPTRSFEYIEDESIRIELGANETVMDAGGNIVNTINLTFHTDGQSVSQYVVPSTGEIVLTEMPYPYGGRHWDWRSSGDRALWGYWANLTSPTKSWPGNINVPCCPESEAIWDRGGGASTLTLQKAEPAPADKHWNPQVLNETWAPPEPRPVNPSLWNKHHPPADGYGLNFTLEEALSALREKDSFADQWLQEHPSWQLTTTLYLRSGQSTGEEEWTWLLIFHAKDGASLGREINKHQTAGLVNQYETESYPVDDERWAPPPNATLQDVTETWSRLWETLGDRATGNRFSQHHQTPTPAGIDWQGCVDFLDEGSYQGAAHPGRLCQDLETGLWGWMRSTQEPQEVIE